MKKYLCFLFLALTACATPPENIPTASVSTLQYQDYGCKQIAMELDRVERKVNALYHSLDKKAGDDSAQMAVDILLKAVPVLPDGFFLSYRCIISYAYSAIRKGKVS